MESEVLTNLKDLDEAEFCQWLQEQKFKPEVIKAFEEADVDGSAFLCLTEQDLKDMGLKIGPIKKLLTLQLKYKPDQTQVVSSPEGSVSDTKQSHDAQDESKSTNTPTDVTEELSSKYTDSKEHTKVSTSTDGDDPEIIDPSKPMKEMDTPYLCKFLRQNGISAKAIAILKAENISGKVFPDLDKEELKSMGLPVGDVKLALKLQAEHMPKTTQMTLSSNEKNTQPVNTATPSSCDPTIEHSNIKYENNLAREILNFSIAVKSEPGPPQVYKLPIQPKAVTVGKGVVMCEVGKPNVDYWPDSQRVVMVVGATGAGKTTLINGMANYIFGVEWKDEFRFKLVTDDDEGGKGQAKSKTKHITAYHFPRQSGAKVPYGLTIIDTPGFGDTGGLKEDQRTMAQIKDLFLKPDGINQLDGIGFVTQSSQGRLTPTQRYIFDSILSIFGKDVGDIIFLMTTFADPQRQPVLDAVEEAGIEYRAAFKFNNSALFVDNSQEQEDGYFNEMFWKMGMKSFQSFFSRIGTVQTKSLQLTREVLLERERLQNLVQSLRPQIQLGLTKIDEFRQEERIVKEHEAEILKSVDFKYEVKVQKQRVIDLRGTGTYTTNCLQCNFTCHRSCAFADDEDKIKCCAMTDGYCTACPKKCKWDLHKNTPYHYEWYEDVETRTSEDLQQRYNIATSEKSKVEALMASLENDLKKMRQVVLQMVQQTKHSLQRLSEIALKPNPLSTVEYIDTLIEAEKEQSNKGFMERIKALKELRKEADLLSKMNEAEIDKYMKADHKTFFQQFQPPPAQPPPVQPKPQQKGFIQKVTGFFTGN